MPFSDISWTTCLWATVFSLSLASGTSKDTVLSSPTTLSPSTCPFRTVNYITHSLPQQCLAVPRISNATAVVEATVNTNATAVSPVPSTGVHDGSINPVSDVSSTSVEASMHTPSSPEPTEIVQSSATKEQDQAADTLEEDSALESDNFLSFEEWKKQNLKKVGQSEHVGRRNQADSQEPRKRPTNVHSSLESLGEDGEIDLDFSGFVPGAPEKPPLEASRPISDSPQPDNEPGVPDTPRPGRRTKDAGTTCKERFNYASFDCAANVLKTNKEAKSSNTVLLENKDSYMLNQCSAKNKFLILELCNDILIDTVVLANFEFFSSTFRIFRVSVSDRYPVKIDKWKTLGTYEARNTREVQAFLVENPLIWARYLRIEFLTHYGNEFYCPVSLVRIHGTTMLEDYKHDLDQALDDENDEPDPVNEEHATVDALPSEAVADALQISKDSDIPPSPTQAVYHDDVAKVSELIVENTDSFDAASLVVPPSLAAMEAIASIIETSDTCLPAEGPSKAPTDKAELKQSSSHTRDPSPALSAVTPKITSISNLPQNHSTIHKDTTSKSTSTDTRGNFTEHASGQTTTNGHTQRTSNPLSSSTDAVAKKDASVSSVKVQKTKSTAQPSAHHPPPDRPKASSTTTQSQPATPTTQESFFKSVQKRLQMLEANSSLSLQYIEDQSRALREAFKKVEQRQLSRTNTFLDQLNHTVLNELREFRQQYDQLWQSTVIELEMQRQRYERDNEAIHARIGILADEVIFQRRMAIMQMVLILVCLALVLFSRGAINNYLELPIVQNVLARSPSTRWLNLSSDSLIRPAQPARARPAHQVRAERTGILKGHRRMQSEDSITDIQSGNELYAPPTPISDYGQSEVDLVRDDAKSPIFESDKDENKFDDPEFDPSMLERPATSPPTLTVNDGSPVLSSDVTETSEEETLDTRLLNASKSLPNGPFTDPVVPPEAVVKRLSWNLPEGHDELDSF